MPLEGTPGVSVIEGGLDPDLAAEGPLLVRSIEGVAGHGLLRPQADGAVLTWNSTHQLQLNESAALYLRGVLLGHAPRRIVRTVRTHYQVRRSAAHADLRAIRAAVAAFVRSPGPREAIIERSAGVGWLLREGALGTTLPDAPLRLDLALTSALTPATAHAAIVMKLEEWLDLLSAVVRIGIPNVCLVGGEAALHPQVLGIVEGAQELGLLCGMLTDGTGPWSGGLAADLLPRLDYLVVELHSADAATHDALVGRPTHASALKALSCAATQPAAPPTIASIPLSRLNEDAAGATAKRALKAGAAAITLSLAHQPADQPVDLEGALSALGAATLHADVPLLLDGPQNLAPHGARRDAPIADIDLWMGRLPLRVASGSALISPAGQLLPCALLPSPLGRLGAANWTILWRHPTMAAVRARARKESWEGMLRRAGVETIPPFPGGVVRGAPYSIAR